MTWRDGEFTGTELAFRCPHCGDSQKHRDKAHCSVNIYTNVYYCMKCQASGRLGSYEMGILTRGLSINRDKLDVGITDDWLDTIAAKIRHGAGTNRYSGADRYHIKLQSGEKIDTFKSVTPEGTVVGYHLRPQNKKLTRTYGQKMFGMSSKIRHNKTWRLVEGVYDILDPHTDFCVFGFPNEKQIKALSGHSLIICPDGDVFEDYRKLSSFMKPILCSNDIFVEYIEKLPPNTDPDECLPSQRKRLNLKEVKQMITPKRTFFIEWMRPEQILENIRSNMTEEEFWKI